MIFSRIISMLVLGVAMAGSSQAAAVADLRCQNMVDPLSVDAARPQLSWSMASDRRAQRQTAYQILVASSAELLARDQADLWNSGPVASDQSIHVEYAGKPVPSSVRCYWKVRIWDKDGKVSAWSTPASWTMGLLKADDWKGRWITASKWFVPPDLRPIGFCTAAAGSPDAPAWADVDLGQATAIDLVRLHPQTAATFPLRFRIEASDTLDYDRPRVIVDRSPEVYRGAGTGPLEFPGRGVKARYVRLFIVRSPATAAGSKQYQSVVRQMEIFSRGKNVALMRRTREFGTAWDAGHATFLVDGMPSAGDGDLCPPDACPTTAAPLLRKSFSLDGEVKRATLHFAALGMAEMTINGRKTGAEVLSPPFTDYSQRVVYLTHDVTALLRRGENVVGATLGNGFFSTPNRGFGQRHNGDGPPRLLAQIEIEFADGARRIVATDETWKWTRSAITLNDVWQGYTEDRRLAQPGWDRRTHHAPRDGFHHAERDEYGVWRPVALSNSLGGRLVSLLGPPVRVVGEQKPDRVAGNHAYFKTLSAGWPQVRVRGKAGKTITIHGRCATGYTWSAMKFTLAEDGPAVLEPRFVFLSGPLDLWVDGLSEPLTKEAVCIQQVRADFRFTGQFHCSNPWLNQLHEVVLRTHLNYDLEHPLDPMREKQGWTQDAETMFHTAAYLTDVAGLYRKWWWDMADNQDAGGLLGSVVPVVGRQVNDWNCPWWSGMIVWLPWQHYQYYGDRRILEEAYEPMRCYVDYLDHIAGIGVGKRPLDYPDAHHDLDPAAAQQRILIWNGASDWNNPYGSVPAPLMTMTAWYHYATIVGQSARILGKPEDAAKYAAMADHIKTRLNAGFFHPQSGLYGDDRSCQTAQVLPLALGMTPVDKRELTFQRLLDAIHARRDHVGTGFVGLPYLLSTLTSTYQTALANRMVNQQDYPSWKTVMQNGALAETWGGGPQMPSCGGAVGMWLYQSVLGIRPDDAGPGFKRFILAPQPDPATGLTAAQGWYDSIHGRIESKWKIAEGKIELEVTIPGNTLATVRIPTADPQQVREGGRPVAEAEGVKVLGSEMGALRLEVGSGRYHFSAAAPPEIAAKVF